jgi:hypothetical protein
MRVETSGAKPPASKTKNCAVMSITSNAEAMALKRAANELGLGALSVFKVIRLSKE